MTIESYADAPGVTGAPLFSPENFAALAAETDRSGLQMAVHAIVDGAGAHRSRRLRGGVGISGASDSQHRIEHIEVVHPSDAPRLAQLGVIASMQLVHPPGTESAPLKPTVSRIGHDR